MANFSLAEISVLLVEDNESLRFLYSKILSKRVKNVYTAGNGQEGIDTFLKFKPELIVTDISMPVMDGLQMIKKIREIDPEVTSIIITAYSNVEYLLESIHLKVFNYLLKPIDSVRFQTTLDEVESFFRRIKEKDQKIIDQALRIDQLTKELAHKEHLLEIYRNIFGDLPPDLA